MAEKVIDLKEVNAEQPVETKVTETKPERKIVEPKPVTKLTEEERSIIMNDFKNGTPQPNYTIRELKNGGSKIVKNTNKSETNHVVIGDEKPSNVVVSPKFTNEQMIFQQLLDLNSKIEKIHNKHKKLKKKYKKMKNDIYVEDVDLIENPPPQNVEEKQLADNEDNNNNNEEEEKPQINYRTYPPLRNFGWRSKVRYV